jgi:aspartyl-tRNA(Asn)/glutamyl-tRNA(Gln) amidotransferase subunit A
VYPLSWTLDSVGPLVRSVEDAALVYSYLVGPDPGDETTLGQPLQDVMAGFRDGVKGLRMAFPESAFWEEVDPEVERSVRECGKLFGDLGASVESIRFPEAEEAMRISQKGPISPAEAYAVNRTWVEDHFQELDPVVAFRVMKGRDAPAHEYVQALQDMKRVRARAAESLRNVEALLVPTTRVPALPVKQVDESMDSYAAANWGYLRNTSIGNVLGLCGLSVPCGFTRQGLPIGLMIYGKPFQEEVVLRIGYAFQKATQWHERVPDLSWIQKG